jgi:hypothetical protein
MPKLTLDLQDGFNGDDVIVRVNGEEVQRRSGVRTKRTLGLAQTLDLTVPEGPLTVEVDVPTQGVRGSTVVQHPQLGASVVGNVVQFIQSDKEFGYG